jgi:hypothetical protein
MWKSSIHYFDNTVKPVLSCHLWDKKVPYKTNDLLKEFQFICKLVVFSRYSRLLHDITEILLKVALNTITLTLICILNYDLMKNVVQR